MKNLKTLFLGFAILIPQPVHAAGWWETFSNWFVQNKRAALCAVGIGATCALAYKGYQRYYTPESILNRYLNEIESKLTQDNLGLHEKFWQQIGNRIQENVYEKSENLKPEFKPFETTITTLLQFIKVNEKTSLTLSNLPTMRTALAKIRTSMNEQRRSAS